MKNINTAEAPPSPSQKGENDNDRANDDDKDIVDDEVEISHAVFLHIANLSTSTNF